MIRNFNHSIINSNENPSSLPNPIKLDDYMEYIVNNDDSLIKIALKFHSTVGELFTLNGLSSDFIFPGQIIRVPCGDSKAQNEPNHNNIIMPQSPNANKLNFSTEDKTESNENFCITISNGSMKVDAYLISLKCKKKKYVQLALNPNSISISIKGNIKKSTIPLKAVKEIMFYNDSLEFESLHSSQNSSASSDCENMTFSLQSVNMHENSNKITQKNFYINESSIKTDSDLSSNNSDRRHLESHKEISPISSTFEFFSHLREHNNQNKDLISDFKSSECDKKLNLPLYSRPRSKSDGQNESTVKISDYSKKGSSKFLRYLKFSKSISIKIHSSSEYFNIHLCIKLISNAQKYIPEIITYCETPESSESMELCFEVRSNHQSIIEQYFKDNLVRNTKDNQVNNLLGTDEIIITDSFQNFYPVDMFQKSHIIDMNLFKELSIYFPTLACLKTVELAYSTCYHGTSIRTLYRNTLKYSGSPCIFLIKDDSANILGAILSDVPIMSFEFYGNGECLLFKKFNDEIKFYTWTQKNRYFIKGELQYLAFGSGKNGFGLWINEDLIHASSQTCETFENEPLSYKENFMCKVIEIWVFV